MAASYPVELVIARYEEDLRWVRRVPTSVKVTVYNKGVSRPLTAELENRSAISVIPLPNKGREAHSYLTHLVERYASLTPRTVFCQGRPFDHAPDFHAQLRDLEGGEVTPEPFLWYGFLEETDDPFGRRLFVPWSKNPKRQELRTGMLYEELFGEPSPEFFHFRGGAQFAVTREAVHRRPEEFYRRALELSTATPLASHSYERIWDRLFGPPVIDPSTLGPSGVRYLKRIRRLEVEVGLGKSADSV
ncbi:MAG: DUF3431 domain-containing protein [Chthoniobacterales bacterium]